MRAGKDECTADFYNVATGAGLKNKHKNVLCTCCAKMMRAARCRGEKTSFQCAFKVRTHAPK